MQSAVKNSYIKKLKSVYCSACLSSDRKLSSLGELGGIYDELCGNFATVMNSETNLCFECLALLRNVKRFQQKVRHSNQILENHVKDKNHEIKSQSCLLIIKPIFLSTVAVDDYANYEKSKPFEEEIVEDVEKEEDTRSNDVNEIISIGSDPETSEEIEEDPKEICYGDSEDEKGSGNLELNNEQLNTDVKVSGRAKPKEITKEESKELVKENRLQSRRAELYKFIQQDRKFMFSCKRVLIPPEEVHYWMEKERNSDYFKKLKNKCVKCAIPVSSKESRGHYSLHRIRTGKEYICDYCGQIFRERLKIVSHLQQHYYIRQCKSCNYKCLSVWNLYNHIHKEHSKKVQCLQCNDHFKNTREFYKHYRKFHYKIESTPTFVCDYCDKTFTTKKVIEIHIRSNHLQPKCKVCAKTFSTAKTLNRHVWATHSKTKTKCNPEDSYCVKCDKQFDAAFKLRAHLKVASAHAGEPQYVKTAENYQCSSCERSFKSLFSLRKHSDFVHLNNYRYQCGDCNKSFARKYSLQNHYKYSKAHLGMEQPKTKICNICGRAFSTNNILRHHIRTHTGERPYACPHCDSTFAQRTPMLTHIKKKHKKL